MAFNKTIKMFWKNRPASQIQMLLQLLLITVIFLLTSLSTLLFNIEIDSGVNCLICDIGINIVLLIALFFVVKGNLNLVNYLVLTVPVFVYSYYISDFSQHPPYFESIYHSLSWLLAGLLFLAYFSGSQSLLVFYFLLSVFTIGLQLSRANRLVDSFFSYDPFVANPEIILILVFVVIYIFKINHQNTINRLNEKLKDQHNKINKVFQDSQFGVVQIKTETDDDGNISDSIIKRVNNSFESKFKINLHEVKNQDTDYIFNLIFRDSFNANDALFEKKKRPVSFECPHLEKWFKVYTVKPGKNEYYLIFEDITKAKKEIALLEESRDRYKVLLEAIPDMYAVIDKEGTYEDFVIKESDLFKVEDSNIIGSSIFELGFSNKMAAKMLLLINSCIDNKNLETLEYSLNTPNGNLMFEMRMARLNDNSVIAISRDITSRKNIQFKLSKALKKAEESDKLKSAFLSNLSHEIRTPLNIITHFTNMLTEPNIVDYEKNELADAINQNGQQLMKMIDNTIHLSKIETDAIEIKNTFCKINDLLREIYNHYMPIIPDSKKIIFGLKVDVQNKEFGFETDSDLLKESMEIFVNNAIKYTQRGTIQFGYEMVKTEAIKFYVSDTGIGIPKEEQEHIFSRFYRVKNNINQGTSGSGIGLPIAQHYIQLLGSELKLESIPDKGTTISFILPFRNGKGYMKLV